MLRVGDTVITMGARGTFQVVAIDGEVVTIENSEGLRKTVLSHALRPLERPTAPAGNAPSQPK